jgi:hypothetical protein
MRQSQVEPDGFNEDPGLASILERIRQIGTTTPAEAELSFKIDSSLISSPAYREALKRRLARYSIMFGLKLQLVTTQDDPKHCRIKIVRPA